MNEPVHQNYKVDPYTESRDIWSDYNSRQTFEHELIDRKMTWLLTSQSILFAGFGLTFQDCGSPNTDLFRYVLAIAAFLAALITLFGVRGLVISKRRSWELYSSFYDSGSGISLPRPLCKGSLPWGVHTKNTMRIMFLDQALPGVFALAWAALFLWAFME